LDPIIRFFIPQNRKPIDRIELNTDKLINPAVRAESVLHLQNHFAVLYNEATKTNDEFDKLESRTNALTDACTQVLDKREKRSQPHWVSGNMRQLMDKCEKAKEKHKRSRIITTRDKWTNVQRQLSEALERDQITRINDELESLELATSKREYGTVWRIVDHIAGQPKRKIQTRKLDGNIPSSKEKSLAECKAYFESKYKIEIFDALLNKGTLTQT
jgi:hypothetical protein